MTSVLITWANMPCERKAYKVFHDSVPEGALVSTDDCLVIPNRWSECPPKATLCLLTEAERASWGYGGFGLAVAELPKLDDGDIVLYEKSHNRLEVVYQAESRTNSLYVTNACNSRCQFCPQPSTVDDGRHYDDAERIIGISPDPSGVINVTGGEPTLDRTRFVGLLSRMAEAWPETKPFVLTNGRNFADGDFVSEVFAARQGLPIGFGIPLYADSAVVHDSVVGIKGAYGQTIRGLYNLAVHKAEIEIRFVVSRLSYRRLPNLIEFVGKSIPFVTRVAVMGLEPMGHCRAHWADFWVDPEDCSASLEAAADRADNYGINMLLYNFQLCCLTPPLRALACSTISEWKRVYKPQCLECPMRTECGGFFASQNSSAFLPRRFFETGSSTTSSCRGIGEA